MMYMQKLFAVHFHVNSFLMIIWKGEGKGGKFIKKMVVVSEKLGPGRKCCDVVNGKKFGLFRREGMPNTI